MEYRGATLRVKTAGCRRTTETARMAAALGTPMLALVLSLGLTAPTYAQSEDVSARQRPAPISGAGESAPLIITVDQLPREVGNRWTFQVSARDKNIDGKKHYYFFHDQLEYEGKTFLRRRAEIPGVIEITDGLQLLQADGWFGYWEPGDEVPYDVIKLPLTAGTEWEQDVLFKTESGAKRLLWNKWKAEAEETVDVPAGTFRCVRLRGFNHTLDRGDDVLTWLAPGTGPIKWTYTREGLTGELVAFERSATLPDARTGVVPATPDKELPDGPIEISAEDTAKLDRSIRGTFGGIGIGIDEGKEGIAITKVLPDTPAERAGLKAGDVITAIDGLPTGSMKSDQAVKLMSGPVGTTLELTVLSPDTSTPQHVVLTREQIVLSNVTSRMLDDNTADGEPIHGHGISPDRELDADTPSEDVLKMAVNELRGKGE